VMNNNVKYILFLIIIAYFYFFFGNGLISLSSPDEVFYVQTAKEMASHRTWMTPIIFDEPQFEKPIFIYWLLRIAFLVFGISSFSARFFPAFFAVIGVIAVYFFAKLLFSDGKKAFMSALIILSSGFYIGLARTVFTDMVFSVMILLSLLCFFWGYLDEKYKAIGIIFFFIFSAFAVLAKGPLGLLIPLLIVIAFLFLIRRIKFFVCRQTLWGIAIFSVIALPWYIFMLSRYSQSFIHEFFYNDHYRRIIEAEHRGNDTWYFYPFSMLGCMFPWSIFVAVSLFYLLRRIRTANNSKLFLACWITITLLIFQFAHSKLTSYIFPMFPALALICGDFIYDSLTYRQKERRFFIFLIFMWFIFFIIFIGVVFAAFKFSYYLSSLCPIYFLISIFVLWLAAILFCLLKNKSFAVFRLFMLFVPLCMTIVPSIHRDIEPYFSSKYACEYLLKNYLPSPGTFLVCSKGFVRGARFYTDMKVAVFAPNAKNYFSPHPIPFLDTDEKAKEFLYQHPLVYGFLKKSCLENLKRVADKDFEYQVLKNMGDQYVVKIQKK
jgi:4-amino-4-deoxy-L-arabinose transferase-like glycosyltransferase